MKNSNTKSRSMIFIDHTTLNSNDEVSLNIALSAASEHLRFIDLVEQDEATKQIYHILVLWYDDHNITMEDMHNLQDYLLKYDCVLDTDNAYLILTHEEFADAEASFAPLFSLCFTHTLKCLSTNIPNIDAFLTQFGGYTRFNKDTLQQALILKESGRIHCAQTEVELYPDAPTEQIRVPYGWQAIDAGTTRSIDYNKYYRLYKRRRPLIEALPHNNTFDFSKKSKTSHENDNESSSTNTTETQAKSGYFDSITNRENAGSNPTLGIPKACFDPDPSGNEELLSCMSQFASLRALRGTTDNLVIGFDSEWVGNESRKMLSWQFALVDGSDLVEYVFIKRDECVGVQDCDLCVETAVGRILDDLNAPKLLSQGVYSYKCIVGYDERRKRAKFAEYATRKEAAENAVYYYFNGKPTPVRVGTLGPRDADRKHYSLVERVNGWSRADNIAVTLVAHASKCDISGFNQVGGYTTDIMRHLSEAQGGLFTAYPITMTIGSLCRKSASKYIYPVSLDIRDSMCSAPGDAKSLADLGKTIGMPKVDIPMPFSKNRMDIFMKEDLSSYIEYASMDAVIALLYTSSIYGINKAQPPTLLSAGTNVVRKLLESSYGVVSPKDFESSYRGVESVVRKKHKCEGKRGFYEEKDYVAVNDDARELRDMAPLAYHGGYNGCSEVGFYNIQTYDYDLQNAYPTAMCLVPDIDWANCIIDEYKPGHVLTLEDFEDSNGCCNIIAPIFANVTFNFPDNVKYPCIPMNVEGIPVFVKSSTGCAGVYACGPELYLALQLGAHIVVNRGFKARPRTKADGSMQYSLRAAVKQLVGDRRVAKELCGKGSLEELILKLLVNGIYGKIAQGIKKRTTWSAFWDDREEIGVSSITNAFSAAMITSIIRAVLLAAQNQIDAKGGKVYSVTTDGFISDFSESELKQLDLYGLREKLGEARLFLTDGDDAEIWEMKHMQCDLLNFTTRGNVSLNTGKPSKESLSVFNSGNMLGDIWNPVFDLPGVCAHNGAKSGHTSDSYPDRLWLMTQVLSRTCAVPCQLFSMTPFRDMIKRNAPFMMHEETVNIRMDFDMKRKPVHSSIKTVKPVIDGIEYEVANFTTEPFKNIEEYRKYRKAKDSAKCLRTKDEWRTFFAKLSYSNTGAKHRNIDFSTIKSVVESARIGLVDIPYITTKKVSVADKLSFINQFMADVGMECKRFTVNDWKNARRPERASTMIPLEYLEELITMMQEKSKSMLEM